MENITNILKDIEAGKISADAAEAILLKQYLFVRRINNHAQNTAALSQEDEEREVRMLYAANHNDYFFANTDEAFHKGIVLGVWGANNRLKEDIDICRLSHLLAYAQQKYIGISLASLIEIVDDYKQSKKSSS